MISKKKGLVTALVALSAVTILSSPKPTYADTSTTTSSSAPLVYQSIPNQPPAPQIPAVSAVLMDADNGQILYSKNMNERRAPASTTKLMTMLLIAKAVSENKDTWNENVPVTPDAYKVAIEPGVSDAYLDPRKTYTLEDMMRYIAVLSANDATVAAADKIGGDEQAFVAMMNQEAQKLSLTGTHYMNPDGLQETDHYTTAHDLALLALHIAKDYPVILNYTKLPSVTIVKGSPWPNTDELLGSYPGVDGLKTGYTDQAGYCYVGTVEQHGHRLVAVVLGDNNIHQRFTDAATLFDYAYHQFTEQTSVSKGQTLTDTVTVKNGRSLKLAVKVADTLTVDLPNGVKGTTKLVANGLVAPVKQGQVVGNLEYVVDGKTIVRTPVLAAADDPNANFVLRMWRSMGQWFAHLLHRL